ncbi:MAG TPA: hypothetical protein GX507_07490 [Clostridia bacterium]|nr:hypothetical protein [Clostridia bacterium]
MREDHIEVRKATFTLPVPLLAKLRSLASSKKIPSVNSAVRQALEKYVAELERKDFRKAMAEAAQDPEFLRDLDDIQAAFDRADAETARMMGEW